jgi:hypothetical protein
MRRSLIISALTILLGSSCATLKIDEVKKLHKARFEPLQLMPAIEPNNLRIDLIRQTNISMVNDLTYETFDIPYHSLGFNLGNGLFYDLNGNLSLRVDSLLNADGHNFKIRNISQPMRNKGITEYTISNDTLFVQHPPRKRIEYKYHMISAKDSLAFMYKKRLEYSNVTTDSTTVYRGKKRICDVIHRIDSNNYFLNKKRRNENYTLSNDTVFLEKDYLLTLSDNNKTIRIQRHGKRKNKIIYTIEKNEGNLFIYNKKYSGKMLEFKGNGILIYNNKRLLTKYELIK